MERGSRHEKEKKKNIEEEKKKKKSREQAREGRATLSEDILAGISKPTRSWRQRARAIGGAKSLETLTFAVQTL